MMDKKEEEKEEEKAWHEHRLSVAVARLVVVQPFTSTLQKQVC